MPAHKYTGQHMLYCLSIETSTSIYVAEAHLGRHSTQDSHDHFAHRLTLKALPDVERFFLGWVPRQKAGFRFTAGGNPSRMF